ncbi:Alpha-glucosidase OS=Streptomyces albaduncus OX=68172 GN=FHS32_006684 PE=3 SV=1 [Streptomyces griseoloalbus]
MQRAEVPADARFFGLGGRVEGPRAGDDVHRGERRARAGGRRAGSAAPVTMPVQLVVADAGTHLVFVDNPWDGTVTLREGAEGAGSGHRPAGHGRAAHGGRSGARLGDRGDAGAGAADVGVADRGAGAAARVGVRPSPCAGRAPAGRTRCGGSSRGTRSGGCRWTRCIWGTGTWTAAGRPPVDEDRFPKLPVLVDELRREGVRLVSSGALEGDVETGPGEGALPDLTDARVRYAGQAARGFAGVWHALDSSAPAGREAHNVSALCLARAAYDGLRDTVPSGERPLVLSRSGWAGSQRYGGVWSGEGAAGWPGLRASLAPVLGLGLCGVPFSGPDVVGGGGRDGSPELYVRRLQLAAYLPLLRTTAQGAEGGPWEHGAEVLGHARVAFGERRRLLPYFVTLAHLARRTGAPMVRPVWWAAPEERALRDCEDAFLLGDALLVAPVLEAGAVRREVRLPRGRWYDTATGRAYEGPAKVLVDAPLERIPVFARAGAVVPVCGEGGAGTELEVRQPLRAAAGAGWWCRTEDGADGPEVERYSVTCASRGSSCGSGGRRAGAVARYASAARGVGRSDVAALEEGAHRHRVPQGEGEILGAAQQVRALGLVGGRGGGQVGRRALGSRPNSSRWPSGALMASASRTSRLSASKPVSSLSSRTAAWRG